MEIIAGTDALEVRQLWEQLYHQILCRDKMFFVEGPQLEQAYLRLFAAKEGAAYDLHTQILHKQQRLTDAGLAERHQRWLAYMRRRSALLNIGQPRQRNRDRLARLDFYYAQAVKLAHPDLYPAASRQQRAAMLAAARAYRDHNLPLLTLKVELMTLSPLPSYKPNKAELKAEQHRLHNCLVQNSRLMQLANADYPYNLRPLLENRAACNAKLRELDELLAYLREQLAEIAEQ